MVPSPLGGDSNPLPPAPPVRPREFQGVARASLMEWHARCLNDVRYWADDGRRERWHTTMESDLSGNQDQLLRAFDELAAGSPATDVTASDAAQKAGLDPDTREFEAALGYLVDVGYLVRAEVEGDKAFRITIAGINEVQRRPQL